MNLPAPPPTTIWQDIAAFQQFAGEIQARITDPTQKKMLGDMLKQLSEAHAKAQEVVPRIVTDMKKQAEAQHEEVGKVQAELTRLEAELEAKKAEAEQYAAQAKAPLAAPAEPAVDKKQGRRLTDELLHKFGRLKPAALEAVEDLGSVAAAWVEPESPEPSGTSHGKETHKPAPRPAKPPAPAAEPKPDDKPNKGDDIWEGLSRMED